MARDRRDIARAEAPDTATTVAAASVPPRTVPLAATLAPAHPCLIQLVRLLARQAAAEAIATQRTLATKGD